MKRISDNSHSMLRFLCFFALSAATLVALAQPAASDNAALMSDAEIQQRARQRAIEYRIDTAALRGLDKIITYERDVYVGKIYNITFSEVRFTLPAGDEMTSLNKSLISQILYADGRRDVFIALEGREVNQKQLVDTTRIIIKNQKDWMKVMVTENPSDVGNLTAMGDLKVKYEAAVGNAGNEELMRQAAVILRKKAAVLKAHCVLIDTKFFHKSYGDLPRVEVNATAYGYGN